MELHRFGEEKINYQLIQNSVRSIEPYHAEFVGAFMKILERDYRGRLGTDSIQYELSLKSALFDLLPTLPMALSDEVQWKLKMSGWAEFLRTNGYYPHYRDLFVDCFIETLAYVFGENWHQEAELSWRTFIEDRLGRLFHSASPEGPTETINEIDDGLEKFVLQQVKALIVQVLKEEIDQELQDFIRKKASALIRSAIRKEIGSCFQNRK
ncbi:MAG: hypothetical protein KDD61_14975 [Bdellovibrionales bacterium]|nr:hypothetical protein [Bdellovibrionales bacterium]